MGKRKNVFLPKWAMWFGLIFLALMWLWVSYMVHLSPDAGSDLGVGGWLLMTAVMVAIAVIMSLMGSQKLPVYVIEEEDDDAAEG